MATTDRWRRLADAATARRAQLSLTQIEVAQAGPLSLDRVQAIEGAKRSTYRPATLAALERALGWTYGSVQAILDGGEPTPADAPSREPGTDHQDVRATIAKLEDLIGQVQSELDALRRAEGA